MRPSPTSRSDEAAKRAARRLAQLAAAIDGGGSAPSGGPAHEQDEQVPSEGGWWSDHTRLRLVAEGEGARETPDPAPAIVLEPGRHASRRRETHLVPALRERLPAVGLLGPQHLAVVALAVALAIGATAWWLVRDRGTPAAMPNASGAAPLVGAGLTPAAGGEAAPAPDPTPDPGASGSAALSSTGTGDGSARESVTVDVVGKVRRPGIVVLDAGARVVDAVKAAGGARRGVDLTPINLARPLVDGEQIAVGVAGTGGAAGAPTAAAGSGSVGGAAPGAPVNLNTATEDQLETLPQVGPVTAQAILAWRDQNGGFTSVDQLLDVQGIGDKTLAQLTPLVTV